MFTIFFSLLNKMSTNSLAKRFLKKCSVFLGMRTILAGSSVNDVVTTSNSIVSGHYDRKIRFWDVRSESSTNEILLQGRITSLDLSVGNYFMKF